MSLFNLVPVERISSMFSDRLHAMPDIKTIEIKNKKPQSSQFNHGLYIRKRTLISQAGQKSIASKVTLPDSHFIYPNYLTKFINKFWQQAVFLSLTNTSKNIYTSRLRSYGISLDTNQQKKFLAEFSKALIQGRIEVSCAHLPESNNSAIKTIPHVKYIWRKGFNLPVPNHLLKTFSNKRTLGFPNRNQKLFIKRLQSNKFPIFCLINQFDQIIIAEPSDYLINNTNILDKVYSKYYDNFLWRKDIRPVNEGLIFINPRDAEEYRDSIIDSNDHIDSSANLNVLSQSIETYYSLSRTSPPRVQFRLVPDLQEVGNLLYRYSSYKHLKFHPKQKYGKDYFQGQPIYKIKPIFSKSKKNKKTYLIKYFCKASKSQDKIESEVLFTNYKTTLHAWKAFRVNHPDYELPTRPNIEVYNLESLFLDHENDSRKNFLLVPTYDSYQFITQHNMRGHTNQIARQAKVGLLHVRIIFKRIIWSLTSRQPVSW